MAMHPGWWERVRLSTDQVADLLHDVHDHHELVVACRAFVGAKGVRAHVEQEIQSIDFSSLREKDVTGFIKGNVALARAMDGVFAPLNGQPDLPASPEVLKSWLFTNLLIFEAAFDGLSKRKAEIPDVADRLLVHFTEAMFFSLVGPPAAAEELRRRGREHPAGALAVQYQLLHDHPGVPEAEVMELLKRMTRMAAGALRDAGRAELRRLHGAGYDDALKTMWGAVHEVVARAVTGDPLEILSDGRPGRFDILPRRFGERSLEHLRKNTEQPLTCNACGHVWSRRAKRRAGQCPKCQSTEVSIGSVVPWSEPGTRDEDKEGS